MSGAETLKMTAIPRDRGEERELTLHESVNRFAWYSFGSAAVWAVYMLIFALTQRH